MPDTPDKKKKERSTRFSWSGFDKITAAMVFEAFVKHRLLVEANDANDTRDAFYKVLIELNNAAAVDSSQHKIGDNYFNEELYAAGDASNPLKSASEKKTRIAQLWHNGKSTIAEVEGHSWADELKLPPTKVSTKDVLDVLMASDDFAKFSKSAAANAARASAAKENKDETKSKKKKK